MIDGEDENLRFRLTRGCRFRFFMERKARNFAQKGLYFKRELISRFKGIFRPISFAIPKENVVSSLPTDKTRNLAFIKPGELDTYIYKTEEAYYKGYQEARFGLTFRKCGWDCMRHYEILANGCVPYFPDIDKLPEDTMTFFPRGLIKHAKMIYESGEKMQEQYTPLAEMLLNYTRDYLTTRYMAQYLLDSTET